MDWNSICRIIRNIDKQSEMAYQRGIKEMILEFGLGWSADQITEQLSLQLGSTERLVPDILVKKKDGNGFIVEVKKPGHKKTQGDIDQLVSYMKQLEMPVGIYWGDEVEVYWKTIGDGSAQVLLMSLTFCVPEEDGDTFLSLFSELKYSLDSIRAFKDECELKAKFESEVKDLMEEVSSSEFQASVKGWIRDTFLSKGFDEDVVETVLNKVSVSVYDDDSEEGETDSVAVAAKPSIEGTHRSRSRRSVGARPFAYNLMKQIIEKNRHLSFEKLSSIFRRRTYVEKVSSIDEKRMDRWFMLPDEILTLSDGTKVAVSNQWGFNNGSKPKMDFLREVAERFGIDASLPE